VYEQAMHSRPRRLAVTLLATCVVFILAGCGLFEELPPLPTFTPDDENTLANAGFEDGADPWRAQQDPAWVPFSISDSVARSGDSSLSLDLSAQPGDAATRVAGAIQTVNAGAFPEFLSGYYRVDDWQPSEPFQYLQVVVVVRGAEFGDGVPAHEVRFVVAGAPRQPFDVSNAKFVFLSRAAPDTGRWTYFSYPVKQAFEYQWGRAPETWESIETFVEVRYDGRTSDAPAASARVYFDDLYLGPQIFNPNPPDGG
jgi:hypothetical protein